MASRQLLPSVRLRAMNTWAGGCVRTWAKAMLNRARLSCATAVEAHAADLAGARGDGRHAGQHGEGIGRAEAPHVADLADQLGRDQRAGTGQGPQRVVGDEALEPVLECPDLHGQPAEPGEAIAGQLRVNPGQAPEESSSRSAMHLRDQIRGRGRISRHEHNPPGVPPGPAAGPGRDDHAGSS